MSTRFATFAITGTAALLVAACGSSNNSGTASSSPTTSAPPSSSAAASPTTTASAPPKGESQVRGLIASVAGSSVQVTQQSGTATVDFTSSTKVTEVSTAALTDVTAGSCISVRSKGDGQPVTAAAVRVSPAADGKCPEGKEPTPTTPAPSGTPTTGPGGHSALRGTVASVAGNTITINTSGAPQTVTVTDKTKYTKETAATSQAIAQGKCIAAQGSQNGNALQATKISLRSATNGKCFEGGGPHRR